MSTRAERDGGRSLEKADEGDDEGSGRFLISEERRSQAAAPPPPASLAEDGELDADLDALDATAEAGRASSVELSMEDLELLDAASAGVEDRELADLVLSLPPPASADGDRVQIDLEDWSLRLDNPYTASSLKPPVSQPPSTGRVLGIAGVIIGLAGLGIGGYLALSSQPAPRAPQTPAIATVTSPTVEAAPEPPATAALAESPAAAEPEAAAEVEAVAEPASAVEEAKAAAAEAETPVAAPLRSKPEPSAAAPVPERTGVALPAEPEPKAARPQPVVAATAPGAAAETTAAPEAAAAAAAPAAPPADANLPELPTREQVQAGFEQVRPALAQCAAGKHGRVLINATIGNIGRVRQAIIDGVFKGTPEGSCMARAVRTARFPKFSKPTLDVSLPIAL